jgi:hypothetical protein
MRLILIVFSVLVCRSLLSQETVINLPLSQPRKLSVEAGPDVVMLQNELVTLGNSVEVTGGSAPYAFQWLTGGNETIGGQVIQASVPGTYTLTVTDTRNCTAADTVLLLVSSLPENSADHGIQVFPVPAEAYVMLKIPGNMPVEYIEGFSAGGGRLFHLEPSARQGDGLFRIGLDDVAAGVISIRIHSEGRVFGTKFIRK